MSTDFSLFIDISEFDFSYEALSKIADNRWVKYRWPLIYFLYNQRAKIGYVGESASALKRIVAHLDDAQKKLFKKITIIGSDKFNKSATLTIESQLIQLIDAEGSFLLQNGNNGLRPHNFYQRSEYDKLVKEIWSRLRKKNIVQMNLNAIRNSHYFKYSPYKSLSQDQHGSILEILKVFNKQDNGHVFVQGSSGSGKTMLATYLIRLLISDYNVIKSEDIDEDSQRELELIREFKRKYPNPTVGLVTCMPSLRKTLQEVFADIPGLNSSMVISPNDCFSKKYDFLIVDETHRLRQRKNLSWLSAFSGNNEKLELGNEGTEVDWIIANSACQVFFYDPAQTIKPSDVPAEKFRSLQQASLIPTLALKSQMRVKAGTHYITFIDDLLNCRLKDQNSPFRSIDYDLKVFSSFKELYKELRKKEIKFKQCRLIAGFAWPWSVRNKKNKHAYDIEIEGRRFCWNSTVFDWVNSPNAFHEIGSIHTVQGYDLNYAGVIFGKEIIYNPVSKRIEIVPSNYYDRSGKAGIIDPAELHTFIINIYKTLMYRGVYGSFVYACDENLRMYLHDVIHGKSPGHNIDILPLKKVAPYKNSVPLLNLTAVTSELKEQDAREQDWVKVPAKYKPSPDYFVCQLLGEAMNKIITNGSYCLFERNWGGSPEGKIVLAQHCDILDADNGTAYTIKQYTSKKVVKEDGQSYEKIVLKPLSNDSDLQEMVFTGERAKELKILGIFRDVL